MIVLYTGTPGSGKSLDAARTIYKWCKQGSPIICNFPINVDNIRISKKKKKNINFVPNDELDPDKLVEFSRSYFAGKRPKEDSILLIIDEAQLIFNARSWNAKGRDRWTWFFTMHRHFGFFIILCTQFSRMLDRQLRDLVEFEYKHRKVNNLGWRGVFLSCLFLSPTNLFVKVKVWFPMREKVGSEFYKAVPKYYKIYDTFELLDAPAPVSCGGGSPGASCDTGAGASNTENGEKIRNLEKIERVFKDEEKVS